MKGAGFIMTIATSALLASAGEAAPASRSAAMRDAFGQERQVTRAPRGHILTNIGAWSPDSERIVYDIRSDDATAPRPEACVFSPDGKQITCVRRMPAGGVVHNQVFVVGVAS
jgi:hypothetical protein